MSMLMDSFESYNYLKKTLQKYDNYQKHLKLKKYFEKTRKQLCQCEENVLFQGGIYCSKQNV